MKWGLLEHHLFCRTSCLRNRAECISCYSRVYLPEDIFVSENKHETILLRSPEVAVAFLLVLTMKYGTSNGTRKLDLVFPLVGTVHVPST